MWIAPLHSTHALNNKANIDIDSARRNQIESGSTDGNISWVYVPVKKKSANVHKLKHKANYGLFFHDDAKNKNNNNKRYTMSSFELIKFHAEFIGAARNLRHYILTLFASLLPTLKSRRNMFRENWKKKCERKKN